MEVLDILDVTAIEPRLKHPTIFKHFDALVEGDAFVIHNDHDPKPLYYQLLGERGNIFKWEYLLQGPEVWEVRITRNVPGVTDTTIGELVAKDNRKAEVFKKFGIDFCCGGKKSVKDACTVKGIDYNQLERELNAIPEKGSTGPNHDFNSWKVGFLADYIENVHHTYVKQNIPALREYTTKVARVHGSRHPEVVQVAQLFEEVASELELHLQKEERVLFPYIKQLGKAADAGQALPRPAFGSVQSPINMMEMEHESAGQNLAAIRLLTNDYEVPADACTTYRLMFQKLEEFESDLFQHIHLENNILFPKAVQLEKEWVR